MAERADPLGAPAHDVQGTLVNLRGNLRVSAAALGGIDRAYGALAAEQDSHETRAYNPFQATLANAQGGLVLVPALFATFPAAHPATLFGTNKGASVWGTAAATWQYAHRVDLRWRALLPAVSADMSIRVSDLVTGAGLVGLSSPPPPPPPQLNKKRVKSSERNTFIGWLIDIPLQSLCFR